MCRFDECVLFAGMDTSTSTVTFKALMYASLGFTGNQIVAGQFMALGAMSFRRVLG